MADLDNNGFILKKTKAFFSFYHFYNRENKKIVHLIGTYFPDHMHYASHRCKNPNQPTLHCILHNPQFYIHLVYKPRLDHEFTCLGSYNFSKYSYLSPIFLLIQIHLQAFLNLGC